MSQHPAAAARRRFALAVIGAAIVPPLLASSRRASGQDAPRLLPTPGDVEGPFYPVRFPADRDLDLTQLDGHPRAAQGTRLYLSGRVLDAGGHALRAARVELWQCDALGHYHHVNGDRPGDPDFQGYGVVQTDERGHYRFKTIRPVAYGSRPPHLHFKVAHGDVRALTTQLYVRGDRDSGDPVARLTGGRSRDRLALSLVPRENAEPGAFAAEFDFVLERRR